MDGFENHPLGKVRLGETMQPVLRFKKSLETWDPRRGEDPGRGNLVRQTERQSEQVGKSHQLSSRWGQSLPGPHQTRQTLEMQNGECSSMSSCPESEIRGLKHFERVNTGMNLTFL